MLIATLPPVYREELSESIASHPRVDALRYNVGMDSPYSPYETVGIVRDLAQKFGKKLWLDLKGRQLRISEWVAPGYSEIRLNHEVEIEGEARVHFRGSGWTNLKHASGNSIFVDPLPPQALGKGQSVNIVGDNVNIKGYLTEIDVAFINVASGVDGFLLSFAERTSDIFEVLEYRGDANELDLILKIESARGLDFIGHLDQAKDFKGRKLKILPMLARDDLFNELGSGVEVLDAAEYLIGINPEAIVASRLMSSVEKTGRPSVSDFADWRLLRLQGYRHFMLSDGLCLNRFEEAMAAIGEYESYFPDKED